MWFDIVSLKKHYRGVDRTLLTKDLATKKTKKQFSTLLNIYFEYIDLTCNMKPTKEILSRLVCIVNLFRSYDINCELIAYDYNYSRSVFDYSLEFLGIDIVHNMCESLLSDEVSSSISNMLNPNGLCNNEKEIKDIIRCLDTENLEWKAAYIFRVSYESSQNMTATL